MRTSEVRNEENIESEQERCRAVWVLKCSP